MESLLSDLCAFDEEDLQSFLTQTRFRKDSTATLILHVLEACLRAPDPVTAIGEKFNISISAASSLFTVVGDFYTEAEAIVDLSSEDEMEGISHESGEDEDSDKNDSDDSSD